MNPDVYGRGSHCGHMGRPAIPREKSVAEKVNDLRNELKAAIAAKQTEIATLQAQLEILNRLN